MKWSLANAGRLFWLGAIILSIFAWPIASQAQAPTPQNGPQLTARAGFDGFYKDGLWLPVRVTAENSGADFAGRLEINDPQGYTGLEVLITRELDLPTQSRREFFLYAAPQGSLSTLKAELKTNTQAASTVVANVQTLSVSDLLFGQLVGSSAAFSFINNIDPLSGQAYVAQLEIEDLPPVSAAWQSLDVLIVSDQDTGPLTPEQRAALRDWVTMGGQLVVMGGPGWQKTAAGLRELLPLTPTGTRTVNNLSDLAVLATNAPALSGEATVAIGSLNPNAVVLASAGEVPLIITQRVGYGQVAYFTVDPAFAPLRGWDGLEDVFRRVLAATGDRPSWASGISNWSSAQTAVGVIPNLELPSPFLICGFLGLYLIIVGPLNFLALRLFKRLELAWFTIPLVVCGFSLVAYLIGFVLIGNRPILHQLSIVQVWPGAQTARVEQLIGLFSPSRRSYELQFPAATLGRVMPGTSGITGNKLQSEQAEQITLSGVRADVASVQSFVMQGFVAAPQFEAQLEIKVQGTSTTLTGQVVNASQLMLEDAVVLGPGGVLRLGDFAPGETKAVNLALMAGRAASFSPNAILPFSSSSSSPFVPPVYGSYYSSYDSTIDDILGTTNYSDDRNNWRRYNLLSALINVYGGTGAGRGTGVYLVGWGEAAPLAAQVVDTNFATQTATLYLVALPAITQFESDTITFPPSLMIWSGRPLSGNDPHLGAPPYDLSLYGGEQYAVRFSPAQALQFSEATQLNFALIGYSYGANSNLVPQVELWNFAEGRWETLLNTSYGSNFVPEPGPFVGPDGSMEVRLYNPGPDTVYVTSADFTLTVER